MSHQLRFAARSDRGLLRSNNQDSVYAGERLLIVADGMGGHAAGDLASRVVVAAFAPLDTREPTADLLLGLRRALVEGNNSIAEMVDEQPDLDGMGTTVTAMLFDGDSVGIVHVGDSRAYLYRGGVLHQLSHDDTFVQSLVDEGRITEEEAITHPQRNLLLRALNGSDLDPMAVTREISVGDRYLICSDGLTTVVGADAIAETLADPGPDVVADKLVELALVGGGPDNVTVIVADVLAVGARTVTAAPAGTLDPDATGPIKPIHVTQKMPRVPLPAIPEVTPSAPEYVSDSTDDFAEDYADDEHPDQSEPTTGPIGTVSPPNERPWRRRGVLAVAILLLVGLAAGGLTLWARSQYYVGGDDAGTVVIYRGVNGSFLGIPLSSIAEDSCAGTTGCVPLTLDDLQPFAKDQVSGGIVAPDLTAARTVISHLQGSLLPICADDSVPVSGAPGSSSFTAPSTSAAPTTTSSTGPPAKKTTGRTTGKTTSKATTSRRATTTEPLPKNPGERSAPDRLLVDAPSGQSTSAESATASETGSAAMSSTSTWSGRDGVVVPSGGSGQPSCRRVN